MSIDSSIVPEINITPPDGELLYISPYTGEMTNIDTRVYGQGEYIYSGVVYDSLYPPKYDVREKVDIDSHGDIQITHGYSRVDWDGVHDSSPGLVYDGSYPIISNISGGILYLDQGQDVIDSAADNKWKEVEGVYINDIENPIEPSDLKNTKSNIRKIKPDINSELKRV